MVYNTLWPNGATQASVDTSSHMAVLILLLLSRYTCHGNQTAPTGELICRSGYFVIYTQLAEIGDRPETLITHDWSRK